MNGSRLTGLTCSKAPGFWMVEHQLVHIMDKSSGYQFLVDTGAEVSILSPSHMDCKHRDDGCNLLTVNSSAIATYGEHSLSLDL